MKFLLSEEQLAIQESVLDAVTSMLGDRGLHKLIDGERDGESLLWRELSAMGLAGAAPFCGPLAMVRRNVGVIRRILMV